MRVPSGDHEGRSQAPSTSVRRSGSPEPSAATVYRSRVRRMSQSSSRAEENTIRVPSGAQVPAPSSKSPSVSRVGSAEPSAGTTNRCWRRPAVQPSLSSLNWSRVSRRGRRFFSSFSSSSGSASRAANRTRVPSGDQTGSPTPPSRSVRRRGSPPSAAITYSWGSSLSRDETKARRSPSGDHRGLPSRLAPDVNCRGGDEPSTSAIQIALRYSFASRSTRLTT